ncbi:MAG: DUF58 domain-containing protein, partial [Clostridiales bacterium]|nr:DUF58 domain-containing protein [Clostridiales bacterium]
RGIYRKYIFRNLDYRVTLSAEEVFEGDDVFMYEELSNAKALPVPSAKVETELPEGAVICLAASAPAPEADSGAKKKGPVVSERKAPQARAEREQLVRSVQSIFVLGSNKVIKRRWRVRTLKRGIYSFGSALVVTSDLLGFDSLSKRLTDPPAKHNRLVVLPKLEPVAAELTPSIYQLGGSVTRRSLHTDPLLKAGARDYETSDPMHRINWKSTAVHGRLMVNIEEYTRRGQFNIVMNMQTRSPEQIPDTPASPAQVERCITAAASLIDKISDVDSPVRLYINTPPESVSPGAVGTEDLYGVDTGDDGRRMISSRLYRGKLDLIEAMRLLAAVNMKISLTTEQMMDHILGWSDVCCGSGDLVMITSYIDDRMLVFRDLMAKKGVNVIFLLTSTFSNLSGPIPSECEVHYF